MKVGKDRIVFLQSRLDEIKEAISKQDIRDLVSSGAILIRPVKGRRRNVPRKNRRGPGKIKKKVNKRKQRYVIMTRKLRRYTKEMEKQGKITREERIEIRKRIRNKAFKSLASLKNYIGGLRK